MSNYDYIANSAQLELDFGLSMSKSMTNDEVCLPINLLCQDVLTMVQVLLMCVG